MGLALLKEDIEDLMPPPPPAMDWSAALAAIEDLDGLRHFVDDFDTATRVWIAGLNTKFQRGMEDIAARIEGFPKEDVAKVLIPLLDEAIDAAHETIEAHAVPLHEAGKGKATFDKLRRVSGPAGKFLRKQINRIEDIRVKRHNVSVDLYYALLAFKSEIEQDGAGGQKFTEPKALGDFLRKQVA